MRSLIAALVFTLATTTALTATAEGQDNASTQQGNHANITTTNPDAAQHGKMLGSIAFDGVFTYQWTQNVPGVSRRLLTGWSITPELNLTKHLGLQGDFMSSYTDNAYPSISRFMMAAGPRYTLKPYWRGTPFVFGEAGETRISYGRYVYGSHPGVDWNPTASAGVGFDMKISPGFAVQLIPAEWTGERFDYDGTWQNSYMARLGFVFNLR